MSSPACSFYVNLVVLNKDEVVDAKVSERFGGSGIGSSLMRKAASAVAKRAVKDERIGDEVSSGLVQKVPTLLKAMGIDARLEKSYVGGPLVVLRCELVDVDGPALLRKVRGEEAARHLANMTEAFVALGIQAGTEQLRAALLDKARAALMEKLALVLPQKLYEAAGVRTEVVCNDDAAEAAWFFAFLNDYKSPQKETLQTDVELA